MNTYTKIMTTNEIKKLENRLIEAQAEKKKTPPYAIYQYKTSECNITAYTSGKVVFQGKDVSFYMDEKPTISKKEEFPQCGSDEVGTGDYFGPVVVCALQIKEEDLSFLSSLNIKDSKTLKDEEIIKIAPILMKSLTHSILIVSNQKYNEIHTTHNMNAIKAKLHNQAFLHLQRKVNVLLQNIIVDQFTPEKNYYGYLKMEPSVMGGIHFETKAESKYLSVACASMIARYVFIEECNKMAKQYDFIFPKGAGNIVDEAGVKFVEKYGWDALEKVAKLHFKNTDKIKNKVM